MRIGIDARFWGPGGKGLGRYTQKLIENLERISAKGGPAFGWDKKNSSLDANQYFVFLTQENFAEYVPQNKNFQKVLADYPWYSFSEQWNMPRILNKYNLDLVHFPHFNVPLFYGRPFVITIHDLILLHFLTIRSTTLNWAWYWLKFLAYRLVIWSAILRARKIITVSQFTKNDILENYDVSKTKIEVTYESADDWENKEEKVDKKDSQTLSKYGIIKSYILYVGNAYPHKNLERLISAFAMVCQENKELKLVLVGKEDYFYRRLKNMVAKEKISDVVFAGFVADNDLKIVYAGALAYVFPSLYEGFGIPPLEAMALGVPVVSSNHPCMQEILGESAFYFDARNEKKIAQALEKIITDEGLRNNLIQKGREQVKKYSWEKMAKETLKIYEIKNLKNVSQ